MDNELKNRILRGLLSETTPPDEIMQAHDIYHHEIPIHASVAAFVYQSRKGKYHIFVNTYLSPEARQEVFLHELYHVVEDMPNEGYILGFDMYRNPIEKNADAFAIEITASTINKGNKVEVDAKVRQTIRKLRGTMPEDLPTAENIKN